MGDFGPARKIIQVPIPQQVPDTIPADVPPVTVPDDVPVPA